MRITNPNQNAIPSTAANADAAPTPRTDATGPAASVSPPSPPVTAQDYVVPSFELLSLTATLQQIPPVRQEVIAETIRRLAAGEFRTPAAIDQTARSILGK